MLFTVLLCAQLVVIDGDTLACDAEKIRLSNIDAPEVFSPHCPRERSLGYRAAVRLEELLAGKATIKREGLDRYGRTLARIVSADGRDVGEVLIADGYARAWAGRRENWCGALKQREAR